MGFMSYLTSRRRTPGNETRMQRSADPDDRRRTKTVHIRKELPIGTSGTVQLGQFTVDNPRDCKRHEVNVVRLRRIHVDLGTGASTLRNFLTRLGSSAAPIGLTVRVSRAGASASVYETILLDSTKSKLDVFGESLGVDKAVSVDAARIVLTVVANVEGPLLNPAILKVDFEAIVERKRPATESMHVRSMSLDDV